MANHPTSAPRPSKVGRPPIDRCVSSSPWFSSHTGAWNGTSPLWPAADALVKTTNAIPNPSAMIHIRMIALISRASLGSKHDLKTGSHGISPHDADASKDVHGCPSFACPGLSAPLRHVVSSLTNRASHHGATVTLPLPASMPGSGTGSPRAEQPHLLDRPGQGAVMHLPAVRAPGGKPLVFCHEGWRLGDFHLLEHLRLAPRTNPPVAAIRTAVERGCSK